MANPPGLFGNLNGKADAHRSLSVLEPEELFGKALVSVEMALTLIQDENLWKKLGSYHPTYEKPMDSKEAARAAYLNSGFFVFEICQKWKDEPRFADQLVVRQKAIERSLSPKDQEAIFPAPKISTDEPQYLVRFPR